MKIIRNLGNNILFRMIGYTGIAGVLRLAVGIISQKAIAVFVGAPGLAVLANFRSLLEVLGAFSSFGTQNAVISETAALKEKSTHGAVMNTVISLFFSASILLIIVLFWQQEWIALQLYFGDSNGLLIQALVFSFPFMGLIMLMEGLLSGKKAYKALSNLQLLNTFTTTVFMVLLLYFYGLKGGFVALLSRAVFGFIIYAVYIKSSEYKALIPNNFQWGFSKIRTVLPYIAMTLISIAFVHVIEIGLRFLITQKIDLASAGLWTAMNMVSTNYFVFISVIFTIYVLPKFSEHNPSFRLRHESISILKTLVPIVSFGMIAVYLLRTPITKILYTPDFLSITALFKWQLIADWFRVIFLIFAYYLVAKKRLTDYFIVEAFSFSLLIATSVFLIDDFGIEGVVMANAVRYIGCLILVVFLLRKKLV